MASSVFGRGFTCQIDLFAEYDYNYPCEIFEQGHKGLSAGLLSVAEFAQAFNKGG